LFNNRVFLINFEQERHEFKALLVHLFYYNKLWVMFSGLDKDQDHRVTLDEFRAGCASLQLPIASDEDAIIEAFESMDHNHGGYVMFDEFCVYVAHVQAPPGATTLDGSQEVSSFSACSLDVSAVFETQGNTPSKPFDGNATAFAPPFPQTPRTPAPLMTRRPHTLSHSTPATPSSAVSFNRSSSALGTHQVNLDAEEFEFMQTVTADAVACHVCTNKFGCFADFHQRKKNPAANF
jgi:hypothetical protein